MDSLIYRLLILSVIMYGVLTTDVGSSLDLKTKISVVLWVDIIYTIVERFQYFSFNISNIFCTMCGTKAIGDDEDALDRIAAHQRSAINNLTM